MSMYFAPSALLPEGWFDDVRLIVDERGLLEEVIPNASPEDAEILRGVAVPGAVNLHSHAFQRGMAGLGERGRLEGDSFWTWREVMYDFLSKLTPDDVQAIAQQAYVEMLQSGYTSVVEFHYLHLDPSGDPYQDSAAMALAVLGGAEAAGIGVTLLPTLYRYGGFQREEPVGPQRRFAMPLDTLLEVIETLHGGSTRDGQRRVGLGLHSLRAVTPEDIGRAVAAVRALDEEAPIHIHVAEQRMEVDACVRALGARPVEWLLANAPVDSRWCAVHATHMSPDEARAFASSGVVAGLCPTTEANLGDGLFPLADHVALGGAFGVGSDSNVCLDPAAELRTLEYGQRLLWEERNVASRGRDVSTGALLYRAALTGGARAAGRGVGELSPGRRADLVVLDPDHPSLVGRSGDTLFDAWIFTEAGSPVRDVLVGGSWVVRDGRHVNADAVTVRYRAAVRRLSS